MNKLILLSLLIFASETNTKMESQIVSISQTPQGYSIYSNSGELLLEFTKRNCDSLSLSTLAYIFETSQEFNVDPNKFKQQYKGKSKNFIATIRQVEFLQLNKINQQNCVLLRTNSNSSTINNFQSRLLFVVESGLETGVLMLLIFLTWYLG